MSCLLIFARCYVEVRREQVQRAPGNGTAWQGAYKTFSSGVRDLVKSALTKGKGKPSKALKDLTAAAKLAKFSTPKGYERWWNAIEGDATILSQYSPPDRHVVVDDFALAVPVGGWGYELLVALERCFEEEP